MADLWVSVTDTVEAAQLEWAHLVATVAAADPTPCTCRRCHRPLSHPDSIRAGIGPTCAALEAADWQLPIERISA